MTGLLSPRTGIFGRRSRRNSYGASNSVIKPAEEVLAAPPVMLHLCLANQDDIKSTILWQPDIVLRSVVTRFCVTREIPLTSVTAYSGDKELDLDKTLAELDVYEIVISQKLGAKHKSEHGLNLSKKKDLLVPVQKQQIFGAFLQDIAGGRSIPPFIYAAMIRLIEATEAGISINDIFPEKPPNLETYRMALEAGKITVGEIPELDIVAGLLVSYFNESPEHILGNFVGEILKTGVVDDQDWLCTIWHSIVWQLPPLNRQVLHFLLRGISKMAQEEAHYTFLCMQFGPCLLGKKSPTSTTCIILTSPRNRRTHNPTSSAPFPQILGTHEGIGHGLGLVRRTYSLKSKSHGSTHGDKEKGTIKRKKMSRAEGDPSDDLKMLLEDSKYQAQVLHQLVTLEKIIFEVEFSGIKFYEKDGNMVVSSATLDRLVDKLLDEYYTEKDFGDIFWTFLDYFTEPKVVIKKFTNLFASTTGDILQHWQIQRRSRILGAAKLVLEKFRSLLVTDEVYQKRTQKFLQLRAQTQTEKIQFEALQKFLMENLEIPVPVDPKKETPPGKMDFPYLEKYPGPVHEKNCYTLVHEQNGKLELERNSISGKKFDRNSLSIGKVDLERILVHERKSRRILLHGDGKKGLELENPQKESAVQKTDNPQKESAVQKPDNPQKESAVQKMDEESEPGKKGDPNHNPVKESAVQKTEESKEQPDPEKEIPENTGKGNFEENHSKFKLEDEKRKNFQKRHACHEEKGNFIKKEKTAEEKKDEGKKKDIECPSKWMKSGGM